MGILIMGLMMVLTSYIAFSEEGQEGFICRLEISDKEILPYQSLDLLLILENPTALTITQKISFNFGLCYALEGKDKEEAKWIQYTPDSEPLASPAPPMDCTLNPNGNKTFECHLDYTYPGKHVFAQPGKYRIMGCIDSLRSKSVEILVKPLAEKIDIKVYELLNTASEKTIEIKKTNNRAAYKSQLKDDVSKFLHPWTVQKYRYDDDTVKLLEGFIMTFNASRYSSFAKLGLAHIYMNGVRAEKEAGPKKDIDKAIGLLNDIRNNEDKSLSAQANYYLGYCYEQKGDSKLAKSYYEAGLSKKGNPVIEYKIKESLLKLSARENKQEHNEKSDDKYKDKDKEDKQEHRK